MYLSLWKGGGTEHDVNDFNDRAGWGGTRQRLGEHLKYELEHAGGLLLEGT